MFKYRNQFAIILIAFVFIALSSLFLMRNQFPVLFHGFSSCACTDYSYDVTGVTIFNPFRDHAPEQSADAFLNDLKSGRCSVNISTHIGFTCDHADEGIRDFEWKLRNIRYENHGVTLYYKFDKWLPEKYESFASEGIVELVQVDGAWKPTRFDVLW